MYEKWIYQIYNVTFTGLHNMVYALFDLEFEKEVFMTTPILYSVGMRNLIFNLKEFWIWVVYAMMQALMILAIVFYTSQDSVLSDGLSFTFWAGGHHVYGCCVLLANVIILKMQHNWTGINVVIIVLQIASYYFLLWYFSVTLETDVIYEFWEEYIASWPAWLGTFLIVTSFWHIDYMLHAYRMFLRYLFPEDEITTEAHKIGMQKQSTVRESQQQEL